MPFCEAYWDKWWMCLTPNWKDQEHSLPGFPDKTSSYPYTAVDADATHQIKDSISSADFYQIQEGCGWWRVKLQCCTHGFHVMWIGMKLRSMKTNLIQRKHIKGDLPKETWKIRLFQSCLGAVWYWATSYRERRPSEITQLYLQMKLEPLRVCCEMFRRKKNKKNKKYIYILYRSA